ncbi:unnamed protein product [Cylindrotheca closterium]|uniref:DUF6824 domain-containing protein n=1 Tax=Cylindrotheca closterium TaxID=2856 RepID=A0AAD2CL38_9STRA|nr:unnamed protein product [Cylindrotheca closterium]
MAALGTFENPRPYDILCGRNRNSFNNIGNRRFRITINMNVEKYNALRSRHERSKFIASLAHTMRYEVGFRFLKKKSGKNSETIDLSDDEVRAKIGHALRDLSTVLRENGEDEGSPDSRVPRPGPYKKQDKKLQSVRSSASLETVPSANIVNDEDANTSVSPTPIPVSSFSTDKTASMSTMGQQEAADSKKSALPEQVRSLSPPVDQMAQVSPYDEDATPLKSNQLKSIRKFFGGNDEENLKLFPLEVGEACESLLGPPAESILPPLDDDDELDEFWTHSELENERSGQDRSGRSQRTNMSIGTFELQNERSGRSQRTNMSVGTFDMSLNSSCCLSEGLETLSLVST